VLLLLKQRILLRRFLEDFRFGPTVVQQAFTQSQTFRANRNQDRFNICAAQKRKEAKEKMATAAEPVKEKKKNRLRSRFLAAQASSLDSVTPSSGTKAGWHLMISQ